MHPDWENESKRLDAVEQLLAGAITEKTGKYAEYRREMRTINKNMWEEVGALSGHSTMDATPSFLQGINSLKQNMADEIKTGKEIKMLERQYNTPYFSRIDFQEDGWETESFYIGIYGFRRADTGEILIYDWRAPVSSIFYDYEPGRARYECPSGYIEGELFLKRQYRIEKGHLLLVFDSSIAIEDSILQDILAGSADNQMKTIVSTIQREQNLAIRCEGKRVLAVQGPAGSGKTSIALHRAAYLLYRHRNTIKAENIRLFTPNGIFAQYISSVLPELGEDELPCSTLVGLVQSILGSLFIKYETYAEMIEWQLTYKYTASHKNRWESICCKASKGFTSVLERLVEAYENHIICFNDIRNGDIVFAAKEELEELFYSSYRYMPIAKRLSRMELLVTTRMKEFEKQREREKMEELAESGEYMDTSEIKARSHLITTREMEKVKKETESMLTIEIAALYRRLFEDDAVWNTCGGALSVEARRMTAQALTQGILYYEDQAPILYLMSLLGMMDADKETKHVIIDEAQDYSAVAYTLFSRLYPNCGITLLGDLCQSIHPASGVGSLQYAGELLDSKSLEYLEMNKSYRSTVEIMEFASRILPSQAVPFGRHGKAPEIVTAKTTSELYNLISRWIGDANQKSYRSVAVICRTVKDCHELYGYLEKDLPINLITSGEEEMPSGVVIIPSYLSKGLEFDAVAAVVLSADEYTQDEDQLLYTVCTRALHRLEIFTVEEAEILNKIAGSLFASKLY